VSPRVGPRPAGVRYRVVVTEESGEGSQVAFDETGDAYAVGVATLTDTRITAEVNHDGDQLLQQRLAAYITNAVHDS
jgi:hypothetical protein